MTTLSPEELDGQRMHPIWMELEPVQARDKALLQFLHEELPPGFQFDAPTLTRAFTLCAEFNDEIWPHRVPTRWELVLADRAGHLPQTVAEINAAYQRGE
jgi:hypothetical protein